MYCKNLRQSCTQRKYLKMQTILLCKNRNKNFTSRLELSKYVGESPMSGYRICGMAFYTRGYHFNPFFDESYVINEDRLLPVCDCVIGVIGMVRYKTLQFSLFVHKVYRSVLLRAQPSINFPPCCHGKQ